MTHDADGRGGLAPVGDIPIDALGDRRSRCHPTQTRPHTRHTGRMPACSTGAAMVVDRGGLGEGASVTRRRRHRTRARNASCSMRLTCSTVARPEPLGDPRALTRGVWLHEDADATRYVVLPRGTLGETWPVTVLGQPAIRLSSE